MRTASGADQLSAGWLTVSKGTIMGQYCSFLAHSAGFLSLYLFSLL